MPKQCLDMLLSWHSRSYHGGFSIYPTFTGYFKVSFCKCYNGIPLFCNLRLMTTVIKMLMKILNNALARPELEISFDLPNLLYIPSKPHATILL